MSFGCGRSCSSARRVSNFNSNVPQGGIYPHIKFERDPLNTFRLKVVRVYGRTRRRDAAMLYMYYYECVHQYYIILGRV